MDKKNAILITDTEYLKLNSPSFQGQTRLDKNNRYKMYWESEGKLYYTENTSMV